MAYLSLYRKYRPRTFAEILGQDHVSKTLAHAITDDRVAHAYLFTGPRGTGKTSTARVLAKALNCERGPTPDPCGRCEACVAIEEGSSMDVIELDAASHSKVEETREILTGVPLATAGGRRKVYVIDEVHMLTTQSFNALLKTLEEPPSHVVFVLATTEAHKVLPTIVSRTQRFDFRRITADILEAHLADVAKRESIDIEPDALSAIARHAEGSARDALSALDQIRSIGGHISVEDTEVMLGEQREAALGRLFDAIGVSDVGAVFSVVHDLIAEGSDPRQLALGALNHARSLLLLRTSPDAANLIDTSDEDRASLQLQAERFSTATLLRCLDLLAKAITDMRMAPNHRLLLEVALVRSAAPDTDVGPEALLGRIERLERRLSIQDSGGPGTADERAGSGPSRRATPQAAARSAAPEDPEPRRDAASTPAPQTPAQRPQRKGSGPSRRATPQAAARSAAPEDPEPRRDAPSTAAPQTPAEPREPSTDPVDAPAHVGLGHVRDAWPATLREVNARSRRVGAFLNPSSAVQLDDGVLVVEVQSVFHRDAMSEERNKTLLSDSIHAALGVRFQLQFVERGGSAAGALAEAPVEKSETTRRPAAAPVEAEGSLSEVASSEEVADPVELVVKGFEAEVVQEIEES